MVEGAGGSLQQPQIGAVPGDVRLVVQLVEVQFVQGRPKTMKAYLVDLVIQPERLVAGPAIAGRQPGWAGLLMLDQRGDLVRVPRVVGTGS